MNLQDMYDFTLNIQKTLEEELLIDAEEQLKVPIRLRRSPDYKAKKALAATYDLQEYLASQLSVTANADQDYPGLDV